MCHSVTLTESSCIQVGPFPVLEILHSPACTVSLIVGLPGHFINLKERLVLSVGVPLLSMEPNVKDTPLVICDLINPAS